MLKLLPMFVLTCISFHAAAQSRISYSDFELTELNTKYLVSSRSLSVEGTTEIKFQMKKASQFFFNFDGRILSASLDGQPLSLNLLRREIPQGARSKFYILDRDLQAGSTHALTLKYRIDPAQFSVKSINDSTTFTFGTRYDNIGGLGPESIMPSLNRPAAKPKLSVQVDFTSSDEAKLHRPVCHCTVSNSANGYLFQFPDTPLLQAFFHIYPVGANQPVRQVEINGVNVSFILSADGFPDEQSRDNGFSEAEKVTRETFGKMESLFGKYRHDSNLTVFLFTSYGTSMEYRGAVQSTPRLLRHELIHQWFATALSPVEYRDIWLNEAITVWLRKKLFNEDEPWNGETPDLNEQSPAFNLAAAPTLFEGYSLKSYTHGVGLMNLIDEILKRESSGSQSLLPVLQEFYKVNVGKQISTSAFIAYLNSKVPYQWNGLFGKLVYGK